MLEKLTKLSRECRYLEAKPGLDEGLKKVHNSVYDLKGEVKSLRENLEGSWFSFIWNKDTLDAIEASLDKVLEDADKKYKEAHKNEQKEVKSNYVRPVLSLTNEDASKTYNVVDKYLETQICPRLSKDATPEFVQSIKESLVDFAAWLALNKY